MFMYCKHCGFIKNVKSTKLNCPACEMTLECVPARYLTASGLLFVSQELRKEFEEKIKSSPEYNATAGMESAKIIAEKEANQQVEINKKVEEYKQTRVEKRCPVCKSTRLSKISTLGKGAKVLALGILGAGDIGKTWKCETCGHKF